jgi:DNA-directed RNA polymerase subunit RPC12/RpoP
MRFACPTCGVQFDAPQSDAGKAIACTACGAKMLVPAILNATPVPTALPVSGNSGYADYDSVADTVGMVPARNREDLVFQAVFIVAGLAAGAVVGVVVALIASGPSDWIRGLILGVVGGLVVSTLVSGFVLMVRGRKRAAKARRA